jgi:hypothetical protein
MSSDSHIVVPVTEHEKAILGDILAVEAARERLRGAYASAGDLYGLSLWLNDSCYEGHTFGSGHDLRLPLTLAMTVANIVDSHIEDFEKHACEDARNYRTLVSQTAILKELLYKLDHS